MNLRHPIRAGSFYDASTSECRQQASKLIDSAVLPQGLPARLLGAVVPHAGWMYSGPLAAAAFKAILTRQDIGTLVLFGADHYGVVRKGEVFEAGIWRTPLGDMPVDEEVAAALLSAGCSLLRANFAAHAYEHSIEVHLPLLQTCRPSLRIVPIAVPPTDDAVGIGQAVGRLLAERFPAIAVVGSSDLTHHGGHFPAPGGRGAAGVAWTERNDRRMVGMVQSLSAGDIIPEADANGNACGAGAIAATVAAVREMGATQGICLGYTNSYRVMHEQSPDDPDDTTVGYAAIVFA